MRGIHLEMLKEREQQHITLVLPISPRLASAMKIDRGYRSRRCIRSFSKEMSSKLPMLSRSHVGRKPHSILP